MIREPGWPDRRRPAGRVAWELWKPGYVVRCEINEHPLGHELRIYFRDEFRSAQVFSTQAEVDQAADEQRRDFIASGWFDRPPAIC